MSLSRVEVFLNGLSETLGSSLHLTQIMVRTKDDVTLPTSAPGLCQGSFYIVPPLPEV